MKYVVVLADGMADEPIEELNNLTPVMAASTPTMDEICALSSTGLVHTVPEGFHPGSEIANMNILGYKPSEYFDGRGVLEAAALGIEMGEDDLVMRCNIVTVNDGILENHSAGHISTEEASEIIDFLNEELGNENVKFHLGTSYRHILVIKGGNKQMKFTPPHDHPGKPAAPLLPVTTADEAKDTLDLVLGLISKSQEILQNHPVNVKRIANGEKPANSIWPWSPGFARKFPTFKERFGLESGAVISAVDLIFGIGTLAGLELIHVDGATGLHDTNYEGKAEAGLKALDEHPFLFLHVEAMDEAGHEGDYELKKRVIEDFDRRLLAPLWKGLKESGEEFKLLLLPDHPTPCKLRTHTMSPVPFMIYDASVEGDKVMRLDEESVKEGAFGEILGENLLDMFFK